MTHGLSDYDRRRAGSQQSCGVRVPEFVKRYRLYLSFHERSLKRSLIGAGLPRRAAFLPEQGPGAVSIRLRARRQMSMIYRVFGIFRAPEKVGAGFWGRAGWSRSGQGRGGVGI